MLSLRDVASSLCAACSHEDSVFRKSFDAARRDEVAKVSTAAPTVSPSIAGPHM